MKISLKDEYLYVWRNIFSYTLIIKLHNNKNPLAISGKQIDFTLNNSINHDIHFKRKEALTVLEWSCVRYEDKSIGSAK